MQGSPDSKRKGKRQSLPDAAPFWWAWRRTLMTSNGVAKKRKETFEMLEITQNTQRDGDDQDFSSE